MPRTSPYSITLAEAERAELEARARRYTSPYSEVVRAKIVLYAADGLGSDEIAARLDTPRQDRLQVAQTFLRTAPGRPDRSASGRTAPEFFPLDHPAMLAHAFLAVATADERDRSPAPDGLIMLTVNEFRRLFDALLLGAHRTLARLLHWSTWRRRHQHRARRCHYQRHQPQ